MELTYHEDLSNISLVLPVILISPNDQHSLIIILFLRCFIKDAFSMAYFLMYTVLYFMLGMKA